MADQLSVFDPCVVFGATRLSLLRALKHELAVCDLHDRERIWIAAAIEKHPGQIAVGLFDLEPVDIRGILSRARHVPGTRNPEPGTTKAHSHADTSSSGNRWLRRCSSPSSPHRRTESSSSPALTRCRAA